MCVSFFAKVGFLLQIAVKFENDLSIFYVFFRQNCFFVLLLFLVRVCFLMILSLLLGYSDTENEVNWLKVIWTPEFINLGTESWKFEF